MKFDGANPVPIVHTDVILQKISGLLGSRGRKLTSASVQNFFSNFGLGFDFFPGLAFGFLPTVSDFGLDALVVIFVEGFRSLALSNKGSGPAESSVSEPEPKESTDSDRVKGVSELECVAGVRCACNCQR